MKCQSQFANHRFGFGLSPTASTVGYWLISQINVEKDPQRINWTGSLTQSSKDACWKDISVRFVLRVYLGHQQEVWVSFRVFPTSCLATQISSTIISIFEVPRMPWISGTAWKGFQADGKVSLVYILWLVDTYKVVPQAKLVQCFDMNISVGFMIGIKHYEARFYWGKPTLHLGALDLPLVSVASPAAFGWSLEKDAEAQSFSGGQVWKTRKQHMLSQFCWDEWSVGALQSSNPPRLGKPKGQHVQSKPKMPRSHWTMSQCSMLHPKRTEHHQTSSSISYRVKLSKTRKAPVMFGWCYP